MPAYTFLDNRTMHGTLCKEVYFEQTYPTTTLPNKEVSPSPQLTYPLPLTVPI